MNKKIKNYIDVLFVDIPKTKKAIELKEELLANMNERMEDYLKDGKSENQAYSLVIANLGDIDELLSEVALTSSDREKMDKYRKRNAVLYTISVMLYILSGAVLIFMEAIWGADELGVVATVSIVAIATGILVYANMSTPKEYKNISEDEECKVFKNAETNRTYKAIADTIWIITLILYFIVSFTTHTWHISWVIFLVGGLISSIIKTILQIKEAKENV